MTFATAIVTHTWSRLEPTGQAPSPGTAHAATGLRKMIYIHGGMNSVGTALDDLYALDTGSGYYCNITRAVVGSN